MPSQSFVINSAHTFMRNASLRVAILSILLLLSMRMALMAQVPETLEQRSSSATLNLSASTIEATLSKFFQFSQNTLSSDSLNKLLNYFSTTFISTLADTNRSEYAGIYTHFTFGGGLSSFAQELSAYPSSLLTPGVRTTSFESRTLSVGLTTDTPILLPLFRSRKKAHATGFRWGMNIEFQSSDVQFLGASEQARFPASSGLLLATSANVRHGGFLSLSSLAFTPTLRYAFASGLSLQGGLRMGLVFSSSWTKEDSVFSPNGAVLPQTNAAGRSETLIGNQISGLNINPISLTLGLGYTITLDRSLQVRPEFIVDIPFSQGEWSRRASLRAGVSVLLNTERIIPVPDTTFQRDTAIIIAASTEAPRIILIRSNSTVQPSAYPNDEPAKVVVSESYERRAPKPKPLLSASVDAEFILTNGQRRRNVTVEAEKTAVSVIPLLPQNGDSASYQSSLEAHYGALQRYFVLYNVQLRRFSESIGTSSVVLRDTLLLAAALPQIAFTPRVVSEADLHGVELSLWRTSVERPFLGGQGGAESQSERQMESRVALFRDTSSMLVPKPFLWKPTDTPELFIRPDERFIYRFSIIDEDRTAIPVDSGFISLRADTRASGAYQTTKRSITLYALHPALWAMYEAHPEIFQGITTSGANRLDVLLPEIQCANEQQKADTERLLSIIRKTFPSAGLRFESTPCRGESVIAAQTALGRDILSRNEQLSYLFVLVER